MTSQFNVILILASNFRELLWCVPRVLVPAHEFYCMYGSTNTVLLDILISHDRASWQFLLNTTNRHTEFQFYWYYDSTCFGQSFCPSSVVLSRTSALVHFMQFWLPFAIRSRMELQLHPAPDSKRPSQLHKKY